MKKSRRSFIKKLTKNTVVLSNGIFLLPLLDNSGFVSTNPLQKRKTPVVPTPAQQVWQECEVGIIFHFDISVAIGKHVVNNNAYKEVFDVQEYNPKKLDTDQWIEAAKGAGAKYAIFTATHFNGFLQWQSDAYPYGLKQAKWKNGKGDIVGDFVNSCRKAGIKPGIYLSTHRNAYWNLWDYYVDWGKGKGTPQQEQFNRVAEKMVQELCSKYGPLVQIWFDAGTKIPHEGGPDIIPVFDKFQPNSVFYHCSIRSDHRWIGNEEGHADYPCWSTMPKHNGMISHNAGSWKPVLGTGVPDGEIWSPGMVDIPIRGENGIHNWFWANGQDHAVYSKERLIEIYYQSVGRNCNLVIGEVITPEGLVPDTDVKRLKKFGDEIRKRFDEPIAKTQGTGSELIIDIPDAKEVNHVVMQENIRFGERICEYEVEGYVNGKWKKLCSGESVGHKRIQEFRNVTCSKLRLNIKESDSEPQIRNFSALNI